MVLWGLCGWMEGDRLVTTADQAGTSALRKTFFDLGYRFTYVYDIIGKPTNSRKVADYAVAAAAETRATVRMVPSVGFITALYAASTPAVRAAAKVLPSQFC